MANGKFRLLQMFRMTFTGTIYKHRNSTLGNKIGRELFEDLVSHSVSLRLLMHIRDGRGVVNWSGKIHTHRTIRRNDSVFGKPPAGENLKPSKQGYAVPEGSVAEPRIGCEVKIIAKSQQKQIGRVLSDLEDFSRRMRSLNKKCINVAVVAINYESDYVGHEGERSFKHTLRTHESTGVREKLKLLYDLYEEVLILDFKATNQDPYPFEWLEPKAVDLDYGAALTRVGVQYQNRFRGA